jgi:hypothetical protein
MILDRACLGSTSEGPSGLGANSTIKDLASKDISRGWCRLMGLVPLQKETKACKAKTDSALIDEALQALLARHRSVEVDGGYKAYDEHPLEEPDEWGDLASFREAAAKS